MKRMSDLLILFKPLVFIGTAKREGPTPPITPYSTKYPQQNFSPCPACFTNAEVNRQIGFHTHADHDE